MTEQDTQSGPSGAADPDSKEVDERRRRRRRARARRRARRDADAMPVVAAAGERRERLVEAELVAPSPQGGLRQVLAQPYLLRLIVRRQLAQMYAASILGLLWSYVQPALRFLVYYFAIGVLLNLHRDVPYFAVHLFAGMVVVHYFAETWNGGTRSIWNNRVLIKKMRMPREVFPVAAMVTAAYHTAPQLLVLVVACLVIGWSPSLVAVAAGLLGISIIVVFGMSLALFFSAINVFARDFQNIVGTIMQFMHFLVPMIYPFERIYRYADTHPVAYEIYMANPVAQSVILMQRFLWYPLQTPAEQARMSTSFPPDMWTRGLITLAISLVLLVLAQRFFSRVENTFPERL